MDQEEVGADFGGTLLDEKGRQHIHQGVNSTLSPSRDPISVQRRTWQVT